MASQWVEVAAGQLKERLIAAVKSNDVDSVRECIQAGGDPNTVCHLPDRVCSSLAAIGASTRLLRTNDELIVVFLSDRVAAFFL